MPLFGLLRTAEHSITRTFTSSARRLVGIPKLPMPARVANPKKAPGKPGSSRGGAAMKNLAKGTAAVAAATVATAVAARAYQLRGDSVPGAELNRFRVHLAKSYKHIFSETATPYRTTDPFEVELAKYCPELAMKDMSTVQRLLSTVEVLPLSACPYPDTKEAKYVSVGGPPAAMVGAQQAIDGKPVLRVNNTKGTHAASDGSVRHAENTANDELPSFISGGYPNNPIDFMIEGAKRFPFPVRMDEAGKPGQPWKVLGFGEWFSSPTEWLNGVRVAVGNQRRAWQYNEAKESGQPTGYENHPELIHESGAWLRDLNRYAGGTLFRTETPDTVILERSEGEEKAALSDIKALRDEGIPARKLTPEEAQAKLGMLPKAKGYWLKPGDFTARHNFMTGVDDVIRQHGGEVHHDWTLTKIYADPDKDEGWAVFKKPDGSEQAVKTAGLVASLGSAQVKHPNVPRQAAVAGVSIDGVLVGYESTGSPMIFGGVNHLTFTGPTRNGPIDPTTGKPLRITPYRATTFARVVPATQKGFDFDMRGALQLVTAIESSLPANVKNHTLSAAACFRPYMETGFSSQFFVGKNSRVLGGHGGGGVTLSGMWGRAAAVNPNKPIPEGTMKVTDAAHPVKTGPRF